MKLSPRAQGALAFALAAAAGLAWFLSFGGGIAVLPWHLDWAMNGDWTTHELGFLHFRNSAWGLPLGKVPNMLYPVGTTVGYTDSIPWLAVFFKVFSGLLPLDWQYIGPWMALCFAANGAVGLLLARSGAKERSIWLVLAGGLLFILTPTLLLRVGHPSLCAHALLLFALWANVAPLKRPTLTLGLLAAANLFAAGVHPYLEVMVLALTLSACLRLALDRTLRWSVAGLSAVGFFALASFAFWLFGYVRGEAGNDAGGFGAFSAELPTLFNPSEFSRFFTAKPRGFQQYEGMAYLGLGVFFLNAVLAASLALRWRVTKTLPWRRALPVTFAALVLAVFALSSNITHEGRTVYDLSDFYSHFKSLTGAFRSSGRFIWPLHYLCFAAPVVLLPLLWREKPVIATALLSLGLLLQLADVNPKSVETRWKSGAFHRFGSEGWALSSVAFQHLTLFPTEIWDTPCTSMFGYHDEPILPLSYEAYRQRLSYNSGYVARHSPGLADACQALQQQVGQGVLDPESVYVTYPPYRPLFDRAGAVCGHLDGLDVCVSRAREATPFALFLKAHP